MPIDKSHKYPTVNRSIKLHLTPEGATIYNDKDFSLHQVNQVGAEIFELCNGENTFKDICNIMSKRYNDSLRNVKPLISAFLKEAVEQQKGHVEFCEKPSENKILITGNKNFWIPIIMIMEITRRCDLKCKHCYVNAGKPRFKEMPTDVLLNILNDFYKNGVAMVQLTGGDPLAHPAFLEILDFCTKKFSRISITTNGYRVDKKIAKKIASYGGKVIVMISVDGPEKIHNYIRGRNDSFEKVIKSLTLLSGEDIHTSVSCTLNTINFNYLEDTIKAVKDTGIITFQAAKTIPSGRASNLNWELTEEDEKQLSIKLKEYSLKYSKDNFIVIEWAVKSSEIEFSTGNDMANCGAGYDLCGMYANGDVTPCVAIEDLVIGNLTKNSIKDVFDSNIVRQLHTLEVPNEKLCFNCKNLYFCAGCTSAGYASSKKIADCTWIKYFNKHLKNESKI